MKRKGNLRRLLKRYVSSNSKQKAFVDGDWKIAEGGYDLWFEIYCNNITMVQCVDGKLECCNDSKEAKKALSIARETLTYCK